MALAERPVRRLESKGHSLQCVPVLHCLSGFIQVWGDKIQGLIENPTLFFKDLPKLYKVLQEQKNYIKFYKIWPYPPKIMKKMYFILVNCMG